MLPAPPRPFEVRERPDFPEAEFVPVPDPAPVLVPPPVPDPFPPGFVEPVVAFVVAVVPVDPDVVGLVGGGGGGGVVVGLGAVTTNVAGV
jgi:hypothetical protein